MASKQVFYYLACGGVAAGLNWSSRFFFSEFFRFDLAVFLSFFVGLLAGFFSMRAFVFNGGGRGVLPQAVKYIIVNILALLQTLAISLLLLNFLLPYFGIVDHAEALAHLVGVLVPVVTSYFGHKFLTFS